MPLEVGVRGFIDKRNKGLLAHLCNIMKIRKVSEVTRKCSKLALLGSFTIWNARHSSDWTSGGFLKPWIFALFYLSRLMSCGLVEGYILWEKVDLGAILSDKSK